MGLPVNIDALVHGNTIEWERLEFKQGWNPEDVLHTMCAFANDLHNWGGGYIIVGIAEQNGQPVLPPFGLQQNQLDAIQKKVVELGHKIQPNYFPISQPYVLQGQHIIVLWCPAGDNRPYTAPVALGNGVQRQAYIRVGTRSIVAQGQNLRRLQELTARIPFDDRINNQAVLQDMDLGLIRAHLQEIKSELFAESAAMPFPDLCRTMLIAKGPSEDLRPVNMGLLFFSNFPERFFPRSWIELVWHKDGSGRNYTEHYFKGPLQKQLREALSFLKTNIIGEQVIKHPHRAEADRFYNFPYDAVEEALSNAVYHKSYELGSPIEVQVWPDKIEVLSHPGPVPPVNSEILSTHRRIVAREYRNRRIGDILKELRLTEGRGTGLPTIYHSMEANGSPPPSFTTDEQTYVLVTLPVQPQVNKSNTAGKQLSNQALILTINTLDDVMVFSNQVIDQPGNQVSNQVRNQAKSVIDTAIHDKVKDMLLILTKSSKKAEVLEQLGLTNQSKNRARYLDPLVQLGWVAMEFPSEKSSPKQRYRTTEAGKKILLLIS